MHLVNPQVYFKCIAQSMLSWWLDHALQYYGAWALSQMLVEGGFIHICRLPWQDTNVAKTLTHPNPNSRIASQTDLQGFDWIWRKLFWWACCCLMLFVVFLCLAWRGSIIHTPLVQTSHHLLTREHARVYEAGSESEQRADQRGQTCPWQVLMSMPLQLEKSQLIRFKLKEMNKQLALPRCSTGLHLQRFQSGHFQWEPAS